jgi:hypothetical protein
MDILLLQLGIILFYWLLTGHITTFLARIRPADQECY